jgi:hypothetical protein
MKLSAGDLLVQPAHVEQLFSIGGLVAKTIDNVKGLLERIAAVTPSSTAKDQVR